MTAQERLAEAMEHLKSAQECPHPDLVLRFIRLAKGWLEEAEAQVQDEALSSPCGHGGDVPKDQCHGEDAVYACGHGCWNESTPFYNEEGQLICEPCSRAAFRRRAKRHAAEAV